MGWNSALETGKGLESPRYASQWLEQSWDAIQGLESMCVQPTHKKGLWDSRHDVNSLWLGRCNGPSVTMQTWREPSVAAGQAWRKPVVTAGQA